MLQNERKVIPGLMKQKKEFTFEAWQNTGSLFVEKHIKHVRI